MINYRLIIWFIGFILLVSCEKKILTPQECDQISMNAFKGMPKAAHDLKNQCQNVAIKYTREVCQEALNKLIMSGNYSGITEEYGAPIAGCFTENDLNKFRKR